MNSGPRNFLIFRWQDLVEAVGPPFKLNRSTTEAEHRPDPRHRKSVILKVDWRASHPPFVASGVRVRECSVQWTRASGRSAADKKEADMRRIIMVSAVVALLFASAACHKSGLAQNEREEFTAWAINLVAGPGPSNATVDITVDRWSTDAQRDQLLAAVKEGGPDALLTALQKMRPSSAAFARRIRWVTTCAMPARPRSMKAAARSSSARIARSGTGKHATGLECSTIASP